jgi:nuclear GTP-binding protein
VAPVPGETKIWQYITLFKRISLIDCPGVVVDTAGDTETDSVLKGVVRAERLENPEDYIDAILERVKPEHVAAQYNLPKNSWKDSTDLMETIARKAGRLLKGGDPCLRSAAITIINDFQRGRLPHYVAPPELKDEEAAEATPAWDGVKTEEQDMDAVGEERMKKMEDVDEEDSRNDAEDKNEEKNKEETKDEENEESDSEDEEAGATTNLIGAGEWDE